MTNGATINLARTGFAVALFGVVLGGMMTGAGIGETPMLQKRGHEFAIPQTPAPQMPRTAKQNAPNHYPLVTPEGTIPVAELAFHGRLRDQRMDWFDQGDPARLDADYENFFDEADVETLANGPAVTREKIKPSEVRDRALSPRLAETSAVVVEPLPGALEIEPIKVLSEPTSTTTPENKKGDL